MINVIQAVYKEETPPIVIMGHSMGGAVAVHVAASDHCPSSLIGVAVIDVVEGTALSALASMQSFLRSRPQSFNSIEDAIKWRYYTIKNGFVVCTHFKLHSNSVKGIFFVFVVMIGHYI